MSAMFRIVFPLIGYVCVATVVTLTLGYGYMRHSGQLDDEKMFHMVALLHDVDLEKIAAENEETSEAVPPEESSFEEKRQSRQLIMREFEAKEENLQSVLEGFRYQLRQVEDARVQYEALRKEVEDELKQQYERINKEGPLSVRLQLEKLDPKKQAKPLILKMVSDGKMDDVIVLLNGMKPRTRESILKTFTSEDEIEILYDIQSRMLSGEPVKPKIEEAFDLLNRLNRKEQ